MMALPAFQKVKAFDLPHSKGLCPVMKFSFDFCRIDSKLDFETKVAQI